MKHRISIPFVGGWMTELSEEEFTKLKGEAQVKAEEIIKTTKQVGRDLYKNTVLCGLIIGAVSSRFAGDVLLDASQKIKKGSMKCYDGAIVCERELELIEEGEVLVMDPEGQVA